MATPRSGSVYQTAAWRSLCAAVKARDGYRCRKCGRPGRQIAGARGVTLSVQHKVAVRIAPNRALDPWNLETLCLACHGRADGARRYR